MKIFQLASKGLLFSLAGSFLWACVIIDTRFLLKSGENPLNITFWIGLVAAVPWLFLFSRHATSFIRLTKRNILLLIIIGISGSIGINYLQSLALANTTASNFAFLYRTIIVFTIFLAWIFFKEKLTGKKILVAFFILLGSYFLTTNGQTLILTKGDIYTLLMAASAAFIANILIKHTISKMHPDLSGSVISIVGTSMLGLTVITSKSFHVPHNIFLIILAGLFSFFQIMGRNRAYKYATASFVTMVFSITPVFVALLSYPLLQERLDLIEMIGGIIIVGSTILVEYFHI